MNRFDDARAFTTDLVERTVSTYVQTFLGLAVADFTSVTDLGVVKSAALAALPAAAAVLKAGAVETAPSLVRWARETSGSLVRKITGRKQG